jgi:hypothetical protein
MIDKLTSDLINRIVKHINTDDNKDKISKGIIEPLIGNINDKLYPYIVTIFLMYILILILIICILIILISKKNNI